MSGAQTEYKKPYRIVRNLPFVSIKKSEIKQGLNSKYGMFRCIPGVSGSIIKEDIVYNATEGDIFKGKYPDLLIINSLDLRINSSRTTASYTGQNSSIVRLSSDALVQLIGQDNYDQVFASLCCVINQELKVKGIFSLLCLNGINQKKVSTVYTQTYESSFTDLIKEKLRQKTKQNRRNKVRSYVVQQEPKLDSGPKKVVIHPDDLKKIEDIKVEDENLSIETESISDKIGKDIKLEIDNTETSYNIDKHITQKESYSNSFPDLKEIVDEDSNISDVGSVGNLSIGSSFILPDLDSKAQSIFNCIDDHIELFSDHDNQVAMSTIVMLDGSTVMIRGNPDLFHLTMPDVMKDLSPTDQKKLMLHQGYLDWKFCLLPDEDGNLPIHLAVLNNDVGLLKRQCSILKSRNESVDILAPGNLTALRMSIQQNYPECTELLLAQGADVMIKDDESRTALHLAAEIDAKHVYAILEHCRNNAREIIIENEDLWKPELENKPDAKIISYLLAQLNMMCDNQGYTPLMLASNMGNAAAVELLVSAAPSTVNMAMPTCGNTALYLAVGAACTEAANRGDKTKVPENYKRTIEILISHGADPSIVNSSGSNVNDLLTDCQDITLSCIIANRLSAFNGFGRKKCGAYKKCDTYMLVKDDSGVINVREVRKPKDYTIVKNTTDTNEDKTNLDRKNNTSNTKVVVTPRGNNNTNTSTNESDKPVILKNLPVITKLVSFGKEKPVLIKSISPKEDVGNKGLKTQITAKTNILKFNMPPLVPIGSKGDVPKYLKILPKPETEKVKIDLSPKTVITTKKKPIILRHAAVKRPKRDNDNSGPSSSKISKT